jgi:hypothetical protein
MPNRLPDQEYQAIMNSPSVQRALDQRAAEVQAETQRRIKKVTGGTANSVVVEDALRDDGVLVRRIGYDLDIDPNGPYWEFGTEDTDAHPTLRAAAVAVKGSR